MKFRIFFKSFNSDLINIALTSFRKNLLENKYTVSNIISLPTKRKRFCVLRSPHVNKDSREHFEIKIFKKFIDVICNSENITNILLNCKTPQGVFCNIKTFV